MKASLLQIFENFKERYDSFVFERMQYINPDSLQKYCLIYCFPYRKESSFKGDFGILYTSPGIIFERI